MSREQERLSEYIALYGKDVFSFCRQITVSYEEAEDLYQDTFLKATELSAKIRNEDNVKSYLISIALRLWKNKKRKFAWRDRIAGTDTLDEYTDTKALRFAENPVEEEVMKGDLNRRVRLEVEKMEDRYRLPLLLFYSAELPLEEIAKTLGIPKGTVKSRLHKAKAVLRQRLEAYYFES
ncbi:MAG: RNA polymerase sigma factor [Alistipes sp.]|nr:RNA polymerase sigma factor [Alistipes sp.]